MNYNRYHWFETGEEEMVEIIVPPKFTPLMHPNSFIFEAIMFLLQKAGINCKMTVQPWKSYSPYDYNRWEQGNKANDTYRGWDIGSDISYKTDDWIKDRYGYFASNSTAKEDK